MSKQFKPQLAGKLFKKGEDPIAKTREFLEKECIYPVLASPKIDGIRCFIFDGVAMSRKLKRLPNHHIQSLIGQAALQAFDGEIVGIRPDGTMASYRETYSMVMSEDGCPDFKLWLFDIVPEFRGQFISHDIEYDMRLLTLQGWFEAHKESYGHLVEVLDQRKLNSAEEVLRYDDENIERGAEGTMIRHLKRPYKYGRSTKSAKDQGLIKIIRVADDDMEILSFIEQMHNGNEATTDNLGHTKRSSAKEGKTGKGTLGSMWVKMPDGQKMKVGSGWSHELGQEMWDNPDKYIGTFIKVRHRSGTGDGGYDVARFGTMLGPRSPIDMGGDDDNE